MNESDVHVVLSDASTVTVTSQDLRLGLVEGLPLFCSSFPFKYPPSYPITGSYPKLLFVVE